MKLFSIVMTLVPLTLIGSAVAAKDEKALWDHLFKSYDPNLRPVNRMSDKVTVGAAFSPIRIRDLDVDEGLMDITGWMKFRWNDAGLAWNESDYKGIKDIKVPIEKVWRPDIRIYNANFMNVDDTLALVYPSGDVLHVPPVTAVVNCNRSSRWFPFDTQECGVKLGSWTYDANKVNIKVYDGFGDDADYFFKGSEWQLISLEHTREVKFYPCCPDAPYASVTATMTLRRQGCKYVMTSFMPILGAVILGLLTTIIPAKNADLRLLIVTLLTISSGMGVRLSKMYQPQSFNLMDLALSQLIFILAGLFACNCIHLALLRNMFHYSFLTKFIKIKDENVNSDKKDLMAACEESRVHKFLDRLFAIPLTIYMIIVVVLFFSMKTNM